MLLMLLLSKDGLNLRIQGYMGRALMLPYNTSSQHSVCYRFAAAPQHMNNRQSLLCPLLDSILDIRV